MILKKHLNIFFALIALIICLFSTQSLVQAADDQLEIGMVQRKPDCYSQNHKLVGFNVELAKKLGKQMHKNVKIKTYSNQDKLLKAFKNKKIDLALGIAKGTTNLKYQTKPVLYIQNIVFSTHKINNLSKLKNKTVGILQENGSQEFLNNNQIKTIYFKNTNQLIRALDKKQIDAAMLNAYQYSEYLNKHPLRSYNNSNNQFIPNQFYKIDDINILSQQIIAISNSRKLANQVSHAIDQLRIATTLTELSTKYYYYNYAFQ